MTDRHPPVSPFAAGPRCRCPRCGTGPLFEGFLTVRPVCTVCGLNLAAADSGDGPAVFVIFIVAPVVTALALWVEAVFKPPLWISEERRVGQGCVSQCRSWWSPYH